jgi:3-hydroxypropanoate dehydrogenase
MLDDKSLDVIFRTARTYNGYTERPVSRAQIEAIWDLMKWGPTSANQMPVRLVWCVSDESKERLAECCSERNAPKVLKAPVSVIIAMDTNFHEHMPQLFPHVAEAKSWFDNDEALRLSSAFRNSSLQGAYFIIAARALGLDTGPMSGFDEDKLNALFFSATPAVKANFISTLGYGDPATIFGRLPRPEFNQFNTVV